MNNMKSVGKILQAARKKAGFTIEDVNSEIKVHAKYIKALENDDYSIFEGKVHAKGFLKIYSELLGLDLSEILALWRREYEPTLDNDRNDRFSKIKTLEPEKFIITPGMVALGFITTIIIGFFAFLFFQYKEYTGAPALDIFHPEDNQVLLTDILDITGRVELDTEVFINSQKIIANPDGSFLTSVKLREGINTISIKAVNKLNKETEKTRTIIYRPERVEEAPIEEEPLETDETSEIIEEVVEEVVTVEP